MNRFGKKILSSLFVIYIFLIGIYMTVTLDNERSNIENRTLAQKPDFTLEGFADGVYMNEFEEYFTDQFPGRDTWLKSYINYQRISNKTYLFNYYVAEDNWIIPKPTKGFPKDDMDIAVKNIKGFSDYLNKKGIEFYYFSAPHKASILQFLYPSHIEQGTSMKNINYFISKLDDEKITSVDMTNLLLKEYSQQEIKEMYFKTDHHWNIEGAFEGYKLITKTLSKYSNYYKDGEVNIDNYTKECLPSSKVFSGSYNNQLYMSISSDDNKHMCTLVPNDNAFLNFKVELENKEILPYDLYARAFKNDDNIITYGEIFTSDHSEINILNENKTSEDGNILLIKDSYANPIVYHIAQSFYKTTIYDPRHNQDKIIQEYIEENDFDVVAIFYNSTHIMGENYQFDTFPK